MRIKLATPLIGEFPRYANVKLPDNAAVIARNMRLDSGVLKPLNGYMWGSYKLGNVGGFPQQFNGYISEFRIRKQAMYLADFTPPTAPFTF